MKVNFTLMLKQPFFFTQTEITFLTLTLLQEKSRAPNWSTLKPTNVFWRPPEKLLKPLRKVSALLYALVLLILTALGSQVGLYSTIIDGRDS